MNTRTNTPVPTLCCTHQLSSVSRVRWPQETLQSEWAIHPFFWVPSTGERLMIRKVNLELPLLLQTQALPFLPFLNSQHKLLKVIWICATWERKHVYPGIQAFVTTQWLFVCQYISPCYVQRLSICKLVFSKYTRFYFSSLASMPKAPVLWQKCDDGLKGRPLRIKRPPRNFKSSWKENINRISGAVSNNCENRGRKRLKFYVKFIQTISSHKFVYMSVWERKK